MKPAGIALGSATTLLCLAGLGVWNIGSGLDRRAPTVPPTAPGTVSLPAVARAGDVRQGVVPDLAGATGQNPFRAGRVGLARDARLPLPPPPSVAPLSLPVAPVVERTP